MSRLSKFRGLKTKSIEPQINSQSLPAMSHQADHQGHQQHNEVTIETLKTPPLRIQPAPNRRRVMAVLVDSVIVGVAWISLLLWFHQRIADQPIIGAEYFALTFLYYDLQETLFTSTIGKHLLGLRVVGDEGDPVSIREALIRNLLRLVDWLPVLYLLGALIIARSTKKQRLGDLVARTMVTTIAQRDRNPPPAPFLFH